MITIIAGSRSVTKYIHLLEALESCGWVPSKVVCGDCRGPDKMGEFWAKERDIPVDHYPANWDEHGKAAGFIRNKQMAQVSEALIALYDGVSPGTKSMIDLAHKHGLKVYIHLVKG